MKCDDIKLLLDEYLEGTLPAGDAAQVKEHLKKCADCREELQFLKKYMKKIESFPAVKAPDDFLEKIHDRIDAPARGSLVTKLFYPLKIKIPLEAAALLAIAVTGMLVFRPFRTDMTDYRAEEPAPRMAMEDEKAPAAEKDLAREEKPSTAAADTARTKDKEAARDRKVAAAREESVAPPEVAMSERQYAEKEKSAPAGQAEITLYLKQVTVADAGQDRYDSVSEKRYERADDAKTASRKSVAARKDKASSEGAAQQASPAAGGQSAAEGIASLAQSLDGRIIKKAMDEKSPYDEQVIVEIPRRNYSRFMKGLSGKWSVQKQYPAAPPERAGKVQFNINVER